MQAFVFNGNNVNLGRFGAVKLGDPIMLTEREAAAVVDAHDDRFVPLELGQQLLTKGSSKDPNETSRRDRLAQECDKGHVAELELKEMSGENIRELAREARALDPHMSDPKGADQRSVLIALLANRRRAADPIG